MEWVWKMEHVCIRRPLEGTLVVFFDPTLQHLERNDVPHEGILLRLLGLRECLYFCIRLIGLHLAGGVLDVFHDVLVRLVLFVPLRHIIPRRPNHVRGFFLDGIALFPIVEGIRIVIIEVIFRAERVASQKFLSVVCQRIIHIICIHLGNIGSRLFQPFFRERGAVQDVDACLLDGELQPFRYILSYEDILEMTNIVEHRATPCQLAQRESRRTVRVIESCRAVIGSRIKWDVDAWNRVMMLCASLKAKII